jgi:hypothetical protein
MKKFVVLSIISFTSILIFWSYKTQANITNEQPSQDIKIVYGVENTFTITIPSGINVYATKVSEEEVSISNVVIGYGKELNVKINSDNYDETWNFVDESGIYKVPYYIGKTLNGNELSNNSTVLSVEAGNQEKESQKLYFELIDLPEVDGIYQDNIKFMVSVDDL